MSDHSADIIFFSSFWKVWKRSKEFRRRTFINITKILWDSLYLDSHQVWTGWNVKGLSIRPEAQLKDRKRKKKIVKEEFSVQAEAGERGWRLCDWPHAAQTLGETRSETSLPLSSVEYWSTGWNTSGSFSYAVMTLTNRWQRFSTLGCLTKYTLVDGVKREAGLERDVRKRYSSDSWADMEIRYLRRSRMQYRQLGTLFEPTW